MDMFCFQCQETNKNQGCTVRGVCGKTPDVAALQDLLIWLLKGLSFYSVRARERGLSDSEADLFVAEVLFTTITNANFDPARYVVLASRAIELRNRLRDQLDDVPKGPLPEMATWVPAVGDLDDLVQKGATVGVKADPGLNEDARSLRELLIYGLKGLAAYTDHAYVLEHRNDALLHFLQEGLLATAIAANTIAMATTVFHDCPSVNGRYDRRPTTAANTNTRIVAV